MPSGVSCLLEVDAASCFFHDNSEPYHTQSSGLKEPTQACGQPLVLRNHPALASLQSSPEGMRVEAPPSPLAAALRSHFPGTQGRGLHLPRPCSFLEGDSESPPGTPSPGLRPKSRTQASAEVIMQSGGQEVDRELRRNRSLCLYLFVCVRLCTGAWKCVLTMCVCENV